MLQAFTPAFPLPGLLFPWRSTCLATFSCICLKVTFSVKPPLSPYFKSWPVFPYTQSLSLSHTHTHKPLPTSLPCFIFPYHLPYSTYSIIYLFCKMSVSICNSSFMPPVECKPHEGGDFFFFFFLPSLFTAVFPEPKTMSGPLGINAQI